MKSPLVTLSESFQSALTSATFTGAVLTEFYYDSINEDYPGVYQDQLSIKKHNDFQPLESTKLNKA